MQKKRRSKKEEYLKKPIVRRSMILATKSDKETEVVSDQRMNLIAAINSDLLSKLEDSLMKIQNVGYYPKRIAFKFTTPDTTDVYAEEEGLNQIIIQTIPEHLPELRIILNTTEKPLVNLPNRNILLNNNISHLVEIVISENLKPKSATADNFITSLFVQYKCNEIIELLIDILLDISMYHTFVYPYLSEPTYDARFSFSYFKVEFVHKNRLEPAYWGIKPDINYLSIASCCKEKKGFNYKKYTELWDRLSQDYLISISKSSNFKPVTLQLKNHPYYGELPIGKILRNLQPLSPGPYLLIRTEKRPNSLKKAAQIKNFFPNLDETNWRKGIVAISNTINLKKLKEHERWISIYKIVKA